jgi:predicted AAA+ superfamily ATPase
MARKFPVVTITGPRQSGKTTLCRTAFSSLPYASLEAPDVREFAATDPRGFLAGYPTGAVIDEVQRVPELLSYLQVVVDEHRRNGEWVLTGSQNFALLASLSQSLAGRTAVLNLLPVDLQELERFPSHPKGLFATLFAGGYPRIHDERIHPPDSLSAYVATYLERDVRQVVNVVDLTGFQTFLRLCAGRSGQLLNLSGLGADAGVSHHTARSWLSVLEAGFIVFRLPPFHRNLGKRLVKTPKLYFFDSGLLCFLLGIRTPEQLIQHPLRGAVFETWVVGELAKSRLHAGLPLDLYFYRDARGLEVDVVLDRGDSCTAVEIKSGQTIAKDFFDPLRAFAERLEAARQGRTRPYLIYGGEHSETRSGVRVAGWGRVTSVR